MNLLTVLFTVASACLILAGLLGVASTFDPIRIPVWIPITLAVIGIVAMVVSGGIIYAALSNLR